MNYFPHVILLAFLGMWTVKFLVISTGYPLPMWLDTPTRIREENVELANDVGLRRGKFSSKDKEFRYFRVNPLIPQCLSQLLYNHNKANSGTDNRINDPDDWEEATLSINVLNKQSAIFVYKLSARTPGDGSDACISQTNTPFSQKTKTHREELTEKIWSEVTRKWHYHYGKEVRTALEKCLGLSGTCLDGCVFLEKVHDQHCHHEKVQDQHCHHENVHDQHYHHEKVQDQHCHHENVHDQHCHHEKVQDQHCDHENFQDQHYHHEKVHDQHCHHENFLHWVTFVLLNGGNVTNFFPRDDPELMGYVCSGHCMEHSNLFLLTMNAIEAVWRPDPQQSVEQDLYPKSENPSPVLAMLNTMYAMRTTSNINYFVQTNTNLSSLVEPLQIVAMYAKRVAPVEVNAFSPGNMNAIDGHESHYHESHGLPPVTVTIILQ